MLVATLAMNVTESLVFREGGKKRPQSEDLPQVAKQGFRELELGFYRIIDMPLEGDISVLGIPTSFRKY